MNAFRSRSCAGLSVCLALTISSLAHLGAQGLLEIGGDQILPAGAIVLGDVDPFGASRSKANHLEPAEMKTDSSSQEILAQADQFVKQERYDLASILWQRVIDESGDQVFTRDEWKERTLRNEYIDTAQSAEISNPRWPSSHPRGWAPTGSRPMAKLAR